MNKQYPKNTSGLVPYEQLILNVLVEPSTLAGIQRLTNLPRSTAEYNLKKLKLKKLIEEKIKGKRTLYFKKNTAEHSSDQVYPLLRLPGITIYRGKESIELLWKEITKKPKGSRLIGIQPRKSFSEALKKAKKSEVKSISQEITDKPFIFDAIVHEDMARNIFRNYDHDAKDVAKAFTGRLEDLVKVPQDFLDEKAEMFLIGDEIFLMDWYKEFAVKISNKHMYDLFTSIFYAVKAYGKRYHQGKFIEELIDSKQD